MAELDAEIAHEKAAERRRLTRKKRSRATTKGTNKRQRIDR
jgi:hypothetical protein